MFGSLKKDAYQKAWDELCAECPSQKFCHDECIECDEFYDLLEEYERELKEDEDSAFVIIDVEDKRISLADKIPNNKLLSLINKFFYIL